VMVELDLAIVHACFAQAFFCLAALTVIVTSRWWIEAPDRAPCEDVPAMRRLLKYGAIAVGLIYLQLIVGAVMRHYEAGLAIPDFPLAFGHLIPPHWSQGIAIHFAHRVGALVASILILATTGHVLYHHRRRGEWARPSALLLVLLIAQVTLGALTVLTARHYVINSLHVVTGASVLATSLVLTLRVHRSRFREGTSLERDARTPLSRPSGAVADPRGPAGARA